MRGPTPSQIRAALEEAKKIGALRVIIDGERIVVDLAAPVQQAREGFAFDHEDHNEAA